VRLELFRDPAFAGGVPIGMLFVTSYAAFLLLLAGCLEAGLGFSALQSGAAYADADAAALPGCALLLVAAVLVCRLPVTPFEAQNALIERLPGRATGLAYSMFLMTGARIGDRMFADVLSRVSARRLRRAAQAPDDPGEFFALHFDASGADRGWLRYLQREALTFGSGPIPHEAERVPVIGAQVDEIRRRQEAG
jgi:hypothetical protein